MGERSGSRTPPLRTSPSLVARSLCFRRAAALGFGGSYIPAGGLGAGVVQGIWFLGAINNTAKYIYLVHGSGCCHGQQWIRMPPFYTRT